MTHRVRSAFGRFLALGAAVATVLFVAVGPVAAQQTTGKLEGTVTDQAGVPLANAQVFVVGTSFGAVSNEQGYYFINNVPVGSYTIRAQFIGYAPTEVRDVRVFGGQTITQDVKLTPSAIQVGGVSVEAAANPIVPRDQVASKSIVTGAVVADLHSDVRGIIALQPGVVESGAGQGVSIRGGRPGEQNVYIDGAPVRSTNGSISALHSSSQAITVGSNAVEEASVTTGAIGVEFGDAQSGIISYTTRSGGEKLTGSFYTSTDEPFGNSISNGYNRFEGSLGGPIPILNNLRFFVSGVLEGQQSPFRGTGWDKVPTYVMGGLDTTVNYDSAGVGTVSVDIPRFVQYGGQCDAANNYGFDCHGQLFPMNWNTNLSLTGKLSYSYGNGSSVSLTGIAEGNQFRNWPGANIGDPAVYSGGHTWSRLAILNLNHSFFKSAERELALNVNLSYGRDRGIAGPLSPSSEISTRDPKLGIEFSNLNFAGFSGLPFPITDQIIRNIRSDNGMRTPLLNRTDLRSVQPYRMNPFGLQSGGWVTGGFNVGGTTNSEVRYTGRAQVDWQANRFHRFNFGGEAKKTDLAYWSSNFISQIFMDAYVVHPVTYAAWASDRLDLGDVVLELGVRYDYMNTKALFANTPGRIFTSPTWDPSSSTNDAAYASSVASTFTAAEPHHTISPRIRVSFPITEKTDFRLSYSHQVQSPDFSTLLSGTNNDLAFTNTNDAFGRDVGFGKTVLFEFGVRHAFSPDLVLDVAAYNKDFASDLSYRIKPYDDPANPGRTLNVNVLTSADFGYARGLDFKLDKRIGNWLSFSGGYTFQVAKNTGSDPFSYLNTSGRQISQVTGDRVPPPEQPLPTNDNRTHNFVATMTFNVPADWRQGTTLGTILRDVGVFATARAVSGLPYTRLQNSGAGNTAPRTGFGLTGNALEAINSSTMPWTKDVSMRINKGLRIGRADVTAFVDMRNVFNFKNVVRLFAETGDVVNALHQGQVLSPERSTLQNEALANGKLLSGGAIDLRASCNTWSGITGVVDCVNLRRVEARFGDGDGIYTTYEQSVALDTYYAMTNGVQNFYGTPRSIRVGFELNF